MMEYHVRAEIDYKSGLSDWITPPTSLPAGCLIVAHTTIGAPDTIGVPDTVWSQWPATRARVPLSLYWPRALSSVERKAVSFAMRTDDWTDPIAARLRKEGEIEPVTPNSCADAATAR